MKTENNIVINGVTCLAIVAFAVVLTVTAGDQVRQAGQGVDPWQFILGAVSALDAFLALIALAVVFGKVSE